MATYKQRAPVLRHTHIEHEEDTDPIHIQNHHLSHTAHALHTPASATTGNGHGQQPLSPSHYNESFPTTTSAFFDNSTTAVTSDNEWTSVGGPLNSSISSSSRRKTRQRQKQQYHEEQQQLRAQEWHFVLNQPFRREQQLQQQQQAKQRITPLSITLNGGTTELPIPQRTVVALPSRDKNIFLVDEEDECVVGISEGRSSSVCGSPLVARPRLLSEVASNGGEEGDEDVEGDGVAEDDREGGEGGEPSLPPRGRSQQRGRNQRTRTSSTTGQRMRLRDESKGAVAAPPTMPMMFLSDDTASSLDFAFSDLTSIEDPTEDVRSLWSHDDETGSSPSYQSPQSPPPYYNVAGFAPFDYPSSPFMTTTTTTAATTPSIAYTITPPLQLRHSLIGSTATPYSSSNSLSQLLFQPTIPQQQIQGSSSSSPLLGREWSRFQTHHQSQMPFHDGSGNFALSSPLLTPSHMRTGTSTATDSESGSDVELELDPLHHFPRHHVYQHQYQQHPHWGPKPLVYQYQQQYDSSVTGPKSGVPRKMTMTTLKERRQKQLTFKTSNTSLRSASPSSSPSTGTARSRRGERTNSRLREDITLYDDSEMEDLQAMVEMNALVVDIPETMGWLQVFEHVLNTFQTSFELELDSSDSAIIHPIKAWARNDEDTIEKADYQIARTSTRKSSSSTNHRCHSPVAMPLQSQPQSSIVSPVERDRVRLVKRQMSASSFDTLRRLKNQQQQYRHLYHRPYSHQTQEGRFHYVVEDEEQVSSPTTLLAVALSALRRFRDHVKSNLMDPALDEELESDLSRLGFAGDLGMVVTEGHSSEGNRANVL